MSETKHTPGPYYFCQQGNGLYAVHSTAPSMMQTPLVIARDLVERNALDIVHALNAHDDLLTACEFLMARCRGEGLDVRDGPYDKEFVRAHQIIANAKPRPNAAKCHDAGVARSSPTSASCCAARAGTATPSGPRSCASY